MPFAPHEIESKRFVVALRGYQTDEVEAFLRAVAADYRALLDVQEAASGKAEHAFAEIDKIMRGAREQAERDAVEIRAAAERDAQEIRDAAARELDARIAEMDRRAEQLCELESVLQHRVHALEQAVSSTRRALIYSEGRRPLPTSYRPDESLAVETKLELATAAR